jgi:WD40 repeat protein
VFVIAVDGSRDSVVVSHPANDIVLGWFPTGQNLLFASDRTGTNSLWSIRVDNGRPQGEPHLLKEGIGVVIRSGFTRGGDLYYGLATGAVDVYTAKIDPVTGKAVSEPARLRARYEGGKLGGIWSADGSRLAYGVKSLVNLRAPATLSVQNVTPGQAQVPTWRVPLSYWNPNRLGWLNADSILMTGKDLNGRLGLFRFGLATGEIQPIVLGVLVRQHFVSEDGRTLFYERRSAAPGDSQPFSVRARDLVTGDERVVYPHGVQDLALSPDGESLAFVTGSRSEDPSAGTKPSIRIVSTRGGPTREIWTFDSRPVAPAKLIWTADGKAVLFPTTSGATDEIWRLSVQGGAPEKVGVSLSHITSLSLNPDGRQLAISAGASAFEIWVMENLGASLPTNR